MPGGSATWQSVTIRAHRGQPAVPAAGHHEGAGGGRRPRGHSAALQARELGADVTLLEAEQVGGTSLNRGPAPVRTLARAARLARDWSSWERFGLRGPRPVPDLDAVLANSARVARYAHEKKDLAGHMRGHGIDLAEHLGPVRFTGPHTVRAADGRSWHADRIVIAVGCRAAPLPVPGGELALTYQDSGPSRPCRTRSWSSAAPTPAARSPRSSPTSAPMSGWSRPVPGWCPALTPAFPPRWAGVRGQRHQGHHRRSVQALERSGEQVIIRFARGGPAEHAKAEAVFAAVGWPANLDEPRS